MTENKREDLMRKIRALLAKANDKAVTPAESEIFQDKADELMTRYMIEEWELVQSGKSTDTPTSRIVDMRWFRSSELDEEVRGQLWSMMNSVYRHARCIPVPTQYDGATIKCVGYAADLDYADLLFTSLMLQLTMATNPHVDPSMNWYDNAVRMREAGLQWKDIIKRLHVSGLLPEKYEAAGWDSRWTYVGLSEYVKRRYGRFQSHHRTYRRSFAIGFVGSVTTRLMQMRRAAEERTAKDANPYAIVVRSVMEVVTAYMHEQFPSKPPPARAGESRRPKSRAIPQRAFDAQAYKTGEKAGSEADLMEHPDRRVDQQKHQLNG